MVQPASQSTFITSLYATTCYCLHLLGPLGGIFCTDSILFGDLEKEGAVVDLPSGTFLSAYPFQPVSPRLVFALPRPVRLRPSQLTQLATPLPVRDLLAPPYQLYYTFLSFSPYLQSRLPPVLVNDLLGSVIIWDSQTSRLPAAGPLR